MKKEIYEEFKWKKNTDPEAKALAGTIMRWSNESWVDLHNESLKKALKKLEKSFKDVIKNCIPCPDCKAENKPKCIQVLELKRKLK